MKAVVFERYGSPQDLELKEVPTPVPKKNQVLVKVKATSVNSWDWDLLKGTMWVNRLMFGLRKPRILALGCDISGEVVAAGSDVKRLKVGDEVFGDISGGDWGGFAEYACADEDLMAIKSPGMSFEEAASLPQAGLLALQGLRDKWPVHEGDTVLIDGAGGGVGSFAIQFAKMFGAEVTAVDKSSKFDLMRALGADHLIDYTQDDFAKSDEQYDMILGVVGYRSIYDYKRSLKPGGAYVMLGGVVPLILQAMFLGPLMSKFGNKKLGIAGLKPNTKDLDYLTELYNDGKLKVVIDRTYRLKEAPEAIQRLGDGDALGKIVVTIWA